MNVATENENEIPKVQKVKLFNIKNGAKSSNLENSIIYVGKNDGTEQKCA